MRSRPGPSSRRGACGVLQGALSPTVRLAELVALRLGDLSQSERSVLELLALGEPLGPAELAQLADPAAVDALEEKGLITSGTEGSRIEIRLAHPVYGDVVRAGISARRERAISRSLADVIEAVGARRQGDPLKVATLRLVGGGGSAELLVSGAMVARARHEYSLTERLARAAIDAGAGFEARFVAAEAAHFQGRSDQAEQELAALAAQATSDAEKARVALLRFDNVFLERSADFQIIDDTLARHHRSVLARRAGQSAPLRHGHVQRAHGRQWRRHQPGSSAPILHRAWRCSTPWSAWAASTRPSSS